MLPNINLFSKFKSKITSLDFDRLEDFVFIIDNISTAFAVAIIAKDRSIHCIYECKEITWRKANFVALYDFILSDVTFLSKVVISVPHPYLGHSNSFFDRIWQQFKFVRSVRKRYPLDSRRIYISSIVSSLLIANKRFVKYILIDEGMGSVVTRNLILFRGNHFLHWLKYAIGSRLLSFHFPKSTPQITLTNDPHPSVVKILDYRDFDSSALKGSLVRLNNLMARGNCNVLVLLKGPTSSTSGHPCELDQLSDQYINFNVRAILAFLDKLPHEVSPIFYLKSHPSLGSSLGKLNSLISYLNDKRVIAYDALNYIDFVEASSLPGEGLLRYLRFDYILALDVSSLLWNVTHVNNVKCFMPLDYIIRFAKLEGSLHSELYNLQPNINRLMGGSVCFYDVPSSAIE